MSLPLYVGNGDGSGSFSLCDEFTNATDLSGYLVLIKSVNTCGDWYKFDFARQKGAKHVLFYSEGTEAYVFVPFYRPNSFSNDS